MQNYTAHQRLDQTPDVSGWMESVTCQSHQQPQNPHGKGKCQGGESALFVIISYNTQCLRCITEFLLRTLTTSKLAASYTWEVTQLGSTRAFIQRMFTKDPLGASLGARVQWRANHI